MEEKSKTNINLNNALHLLETLHSTIESVGLLSEFQVENNLGITDAYLNRKIVLQVHDEEAEVQQALIKIFKVVVNEVIKLYPVLLDEAESDFKPSIYDNSEISKQLKLPFPEPF